MLAASFAVCNPSRVEVVHGSFWMLLPTSDPDVLKRMRAWVAALLRPWPARRVLDATIVIDELATNAFLHGRPPYIARIVVTDGGRVALLEVHDAGPRPMGSWELGPGLRLVASVASEWGVSRRRFGTVVWAQVPVDRAAAQERSA